MQTVTPYLLYKSCENALDWLSSAFGFEEVLRYTGAEGYVNHAEMSVGGGESIMMGNPGEGYRNPKELGQETVGLYVMVDDVDAHFERAKAAGAEIRQEPEDEEYGHRRYTSVDPEGHHWFFASVIEEKTPEEWGATPAEAAR
jgi:PhnB protein